MDTIRREEIEFRNMLDSVKGIILKVCYTFSEGGKADPDDLYQDIMVDLWNGMHTFRKNSDIKTWVYRVAVNRALMYRRQQKHDSGIVLEPIDSKMADQLADVQEDKQIKTLYELIDRLSEEEKTIIFLYIDRVKTDQIALATGKTEDAVRQDIHRIKKKLKKLYEKEKDK